MTSEDLLCRAIRERRLVSFVYEGTSPSRRTVEPHIIGRSREGHLLLSGWQRTGGSGEGWRNYHVPTMSDLAASDERFAGPRPGYNPDDDTFARILCGL